MEHSWLEIVLIPTALSIGGLWILSAAWAYTEYEKRSYKDGIVTREQPAISFFICRGMIALYKIQSNPNVDFLTDRKRNLNP